MAEGKQTVRGLEGSEPLDNDGAGSVLVASKDAVAQPAEGSLKHEDRVADGTAGKPEESPVRTARPDVAIIGRLATGAGQHNPTAFLSEDHDTESGRFIQPDAKKK